MLYCNIQSITHFIFFLQKKKSKIKAQSDQKYNIVIISIKNSLLSKKVLNTSSKKSLHKLSANSNASKWKISQKL